MQEVQDEKKRLRSEMLDKRRSLPANQVTTASQAIAGYFYDWPEYFNAQTVMFYLARADEPQTDQLIQHALDHGKKVCVPLLGQQLGEMSAARIWGLAGLVKGKLGLRGPNPATSILIVPEDIDLVVVPGVVFDYQGNRVGFGAGYYDRFLQKTSKSILLGLAWSFQLMEQLPSEDHDVRLQYLLTEGGFLFCKGRKE